MTTQSIMAPETTAIVLIGYQNDYYAPNGVLHHFLENSASVRTSLLRTVALVEQLASTPATIIETPIVFTHDYSELRDPVGILAAIRDARAFQVDTWGVGTAEELLPYQHRILSIPGKRGLNAFLGTRLEEELRARAITDVVLCGSVVSICIDSTGRSAAERGFHVTILSDCITGRTRIEQDFYCQQIFPLYAEVLTAADLAERLLAI